jgi:hypothetical protein
MDEPGIFILEIACMIGAPMDDGSREALQDIVRNRFFLQDAGEATHLSEGLV